MRKPILWQTASSADWELACQREAVLAAQASLSPEAIREAAATLQCQRSLVYRLIALYRKRPQTSTLLRQRGGRARGSRFLDSQREALLDEVIQHYYLSRQRPRLADLCRELETTCRQQGLRMPNFRSIKRRLDSLDPALVVQERHGRKAATERFHPVKANSQGPWQPLDVVQIDHTPADVIVVDERERLPIGRPWLSLAIDVATRTVPGFAVSLEQPSTVSVALVLTQAVLPKDSWLADRELSVPWPISGLPAALHLDNAPEFHADVLTRAAQEYGIRLD